MFGIVAFVLALVAVFAVKAVSIAQTHDSLIANSAAFSWMTPTPEDAIVPEGETVGASQAASARSTAAPVSAFSRRARIA